jgi:hypothetical protein
MCPFTTSAARLPLVEHASAANKQNSTSKVRDLSAQCVFGGEASFLAVFIVTSLRLRQDRLVYK